MKILVNNKQNLLLLELVSNIILLRYVSPELLKDDECL